MSNMGLFGYSIVVLLRYSSKYIWVNNEGDQWVNDSFFKLNN